MRIVGSKDALGYRFNNVIEMQAAASDLETKDEPIFQLAALRLRLACTGWELDKIAEYLSLTRPWLRHLDKFVGRLCEMHAPENRFYQVPLTRKRKPREGWALEIVQRHIQLKNVLKAAK